MGQPWEKSRGPILATELDISKAKAINSLLTRPITILPAKPGDPILPFAIGLFAEIRALLKAEAGVTALRRAASAYVYAKRYYFASAQPDAFRHNLDGQPEEPVSAEDRVAAKMQFLALTQKQSDADDGTKDALAPPLSKSDQIRAALLNRRKSNV